MSATIDTMTTRESSPQSNAGERLIVALDLPDAKSALRMVDQLEGTCKWFKVGLELYLADGKIILEKLASRGLSVFLDLKLHDIPNTVASAVGTLSSSGVSLLTLHACGGPAMLAAAAEAAASIPGAPKLLAVTVLTSFDEQQLTAIGVSASPAVQVLRLSQIATANGMSGLVCSPAEVFLLRRELRQDCLLVTPGIRPTGSDSNDQKRFATPAAAITAGADMLVVGRPITQAADPAAAATAILAEIESAAASV